MQPSLEMQKPGPSSDTLVPVRVFVLSVSLAPVTLAISDVANNVPSTNAILIFMSMVFYSSFWSAGACHRFSIRSGSSSVRNCRYCQSVATMHALCHRHTPRFASTLPRRVVKSGGKPPHAKVLLVLYRFHKLRQYPRSWRIGHRAEEGIRGGSRPGSGRSAGGRARATSAETH